MAQSTDLQCTLHAMDLVELGRHLAQFLRMNDLEQLVVFGPQAILVSTFGMFYRAS